MSEWFVHLVGTLGERLTDSRDDIYVPTWEWIPNNLGEYDLLASVEGHPQMLVVERGMAHAYRLVNHDNQRTFDAQLSYDIKVHLGDRIVYEKVIISGNLVWLIEEYLPLRPPIYQKGEIG
jgi:hypothetical protein